MDEPLDSTRYLLGWRCLWKSGSTLVAHRRGHDPAPDDPFGGLYLSDEVVDALLAHASPPPQASSEVVAHWRIALTRPNPRAWNFDCAHSLGRPSCPSRMSNSSSFV